MLKRHGRVVLFLPPYGGSLLGPPLGLLSLAGSLREAGYEAVIIDGALDRDYLAANCSEVLEGASASAFPSDWPDDPRRHRDQPHGVGGCVPICRLFLAAGIRVC